jgi:pilus assembly protein FimV
MTVQSALGEPLRAEIDVPEINAEEAASLKTRVAAPEAFTAAGLDYNPAMTTLQATLQRRPDGRAYIRLSSDRTINDPFVDVILEATWSSGRVTRDYTMLFDPPVLRSKTAPAPTLPQTSGVPSGAAVSAPVQTPAASATPAAEPAPAAPARAARTAPAKAASKASTEAKATATDAQRVVVKSGETASKIAANLKPAGVSLDQMLVALLRANPDAFVNDNINRIRAGAVMAVPSAEQAQAISAAEATQTVVAQSKDFNDFRRHLASSAPVAAVGAADRKASGTVTARVEDKKPAAATPDKLTLSKGAVQAKADDAKIAKERADKEAAARAAEITKNITDLKKVGAAIAPPAAAPAAAASTAQPAVVPAVAAPAAAVASAPAPVASAPAAVASAPAAVTSAAAAPASAVAKPKPKVAPVVAPVEPPSLMDDLLENPLIPAGGIGLLALLGGFGFYRMRQRKKSPSDMDSSFLESRLQPDSFFGASGGQRIDTANEGNATGSSMVYSASQLDAADDVDPVAEADVYLAYGRDLQAEEILKEAVRTNPGRLAIHTKLLEIFAKRRDAKSFEATAAQAYKLTNANSPEWTRICEMGLSFDPGNAMYHPGGVPDNGAAEPVAAAPEMPAFASSTVPQPTRAEVAASAPVPGMDLDLDLDFSLDGEPVSAISDITGGSIPQTQPEPTVKMEAMGAGAPTDMSMDFDLSDDAPTAPPVQAAPAPLPEISLSLGADAGPALHFDATAPMAVQQETPLPAAGNDSGMLEFDLGSLSLDLDTPSEVPTQSPLDTQEDPLETKLALAEEFISIGDEDGARSLIEEVISESSGDMRAKAQRTLAKLS